MLEFKTVSLAAAGLTGILFLCLLLVPDFIFFIFNIEGGETARLISRRAAMLFLGLAAISYVGRNAPHSAARQAISLGFSVNMFGLALTGVFEFTRGYAGVLILAAAATEVAFGLAFGRIWVMNRSVS